MGIFAAWREPRKKEHYTEALDALTALKQIRKLHPEITRACSAVCSVDYCWSTATSIGPSGKPLCSTYTERLYNASPKDKALKDIEWIRDHGEFGGQLPPAKQAACEQNANTLYGTFLC